jgi:hypothetical protein
MISVFLTRAIALSKSVVFLECLARYFSEVSRDFSLHLLSRLCNSQRSHNFKFPVLHSALRKSNVSDDKSDLWE